jgi:hypothetical protein
MRELASHQFEGKKLTQVLAPSKRRSQGGTPSYTGRSHQESITNSSRIYFPELYVLDGPCYFSSILVAKVDMNIQK